MENNLKIVDLFCGIGGFHLGAKKAANALSRDLECILACDRNKQAKDAYLVNFPKLETKFSNDIREINSEEVENYDILCAGFPCQSFSLIGKKDGLHSKEQGALFYDLNNFLKTTRPKAFLFENVRSLKSHDKGRTFETIESFIKKSGYSLFYKIIKATDFGLPQNRVRIFLVGFRNDLNLKEFHFPEKFDGYSLTLKEILNVDWCEREIGYTLRVSGRGSKYGTRHNWEYYKVQEKGVDYTSIKRIEPHHGKKMMGFPENWYTGHTVTSSMARLGNSVPVTIVEAIVKEIILCLDSQ
jgi:DNA (cytosine-5)-methyltransferase 1